MTRSCPECGSNELITDKSARGTHWQCKKCGYFGTVEVDFPDESLKKMKVEETGKKLEKRMRKLEGWGRR